MWNVDPATRRAMPPETDRRHCRRPTRQEVASGRAYMDPRARATASYVAGEESVDGTSSRTAIVVDARIDHRTYLSRNSMKRRP